MPSFKYRSESDSEPEREERHAGNEASDDDEPGPDDTFHFRKSFPKGHPRHYAPSLDEEMEEPSFQVECSAENISYEEMDDDEEAYTEDEASLSNEDVEEGSVYDPLAAVVRIEKLSNWLEQVDYTDRAVKRLKAIDARERLTNSKVHWGGRIPEITYSTEDLERDLFGETPKVSGFL